MSSLVLYTQGDKQWISDTEIPVPNEDVFVELMIKRCKGSETIDEIIGRLLEEEGIGYEELIYHLSLEKLLQAQSLDRHCSFSKLVIDVNNCAELDNYIDISHGDTGYREILNVFTTRTKMKVFMNLSYKVVEFRKKKRKVIVIDSDSDTTESSESE